MSDREISTYLKWKDLCDQLKTESKASKDVKEASREEDRGLIAAALIFLNSNDPISDWKKMCKILRGERVKEASQDGIRGLIAALLLISGEK